MCSYFLHVVSDSGLRIRLFASNTSIYFSLIDTPVEYRLGLQFYLIEKTNFDTPDVIFYQSNDMLCAPLKLYMIFTRALKHSVIAYLFLLLFMQLIVYSLIRIGLYMLY